MSEKYPNVYVALAAFQHDTTILTKSADNPFFNSKYVPLPKIILELAEKLKEYGLSIIQIPSSVEDKPSLKTIVFHAESETKIEENAILVLSKPDPQAQGSAITYMRRYARETILGIATEEDDDGNKATFSDKQIEAKKEEKQVPLKEISEDKLASHEAISTIAFDRKKLGDAEQKIFDSWMKAQGGYRDWETDRKSVV